MLGYTTKHSNSATKSSSDYNNPGYIPRIFCLSHIFSFVAFCPLAKGGFDDTLVPVSVKRKKEVYLPPSGRHNSTQAEKQKRE
jgi:hypothetical protein